MDLKLNGKNILNIVKKELNATFNSPASYIVLVVFLVLWEFMFFRNAFLISTASIRDLFDWLPWLLLVFVPAITMGSISKESDEGTLELVLTHPVKELELVLGKFFGALVFAATALLFSFGIALSFSKFGQFDWGIYTAQLLGALLFAAALISMGIFVSSLVKSQVASLLLTIGLGFLFIIAGTDFLTQTFPFFIANILNRLALLTHFMSVSKGVIDIRDVIYFLAFIKIFLALAYLQLLKRKYGNNKQRYLILQTGIFLFVGIFILTSVLGERLSLRLDISRGQVFTLSKATKETLGKVKDLITITLYTSQKLPPESTAVLREVKDTLNDYKANSKGNIQIKTIDPSKDPALAQEAQTLGVPEVRFNLLQGQEFQSVTGYLGLVVSYAGKNEVIPFLKDTSDLEYQLTGIINKLTQKTKKVVAFVVGSGEKNLSDYSLLQKELATQYDVQTVDLKTEGTKIATNISSLIVAGPSEAYTDGAKTEIRNFMKTGKGVMFLVDTESVTPSQYSVIGTKQTESLTELLKEIGVTVNGDSVYDLQYNETIQLNAGPSGMYLIPYAYWIKAMPQDKSNQITTKLDSISFPWPSSIATDSAKLKELGYTELKLLTTGPNAGTSPIGTDLNPTTKPAQQGLGQKTVAIGLEPVKEKTNELSKLIVIGDSDFLADTAVQNSVQNAVFALNSVSWLSQEQSFGAIKIKSDAFGTLKFANKTQPELIKYGNMGLAVLLPILFAVIKLAMRRNLRDRGYDL